MFRIHSGFTVSKFRVFRVFRIHRGLTVSKFRVFRVLEFTADSQRPFKAPPCLKFRVLRMFRGFTASIQSTTMLQIQSVQSV